MQHTVPCTRVGFAAPAAVEPATVSKKGKGPRPAVQGMPQCGQCRVRPDVYSMPQGEAVRPRAGCTAWPSTLSTML